MFSEHVHTVSCIIVFRDLEALLVRAVSGAPYIKELVKGALCFYKFATSHKSVMPSLDCESFKFFYNSFFPAPSDTDSSDTTVLHL